MLNYLQKYIKISYMTGKIVPTNFSVTLTDLQWGGCLDKQTAV